MKVFDLEVSGISLHSASRSYHTDRYSCSPDESMVEAGRNVSDLGVHATYAQGMALIVTDGGHTRRAYKSVQKGEWICMHDGCSLPLLLRRREDGKYQYVGEALCPAQGIAQKSAFANTEAEVRCRVAGVAVFGVCLQWIREARLHRIEPKMCHNRCTPLRDRVSASGPSVRRSWQHC